VQYENFDLLLERGSDSFVARVIASSADEATEPFQLGISVEQVEIFLLRIGRPRRSTRRVDSPEMTAAKNFGSLVYSAVFRESIRDCFHRSLVETQGRGHGLRLRIRLRDVPELSDIPWELLHDRTRNKFLALSSSTPRRAVS
jgi:hypothetical protein